MEVEDFVRLSSSEKPIAVWNLLDDAGRCLVFCQSTDYRHLTLLKAAILGPGNCVSGWK
jgi:hypothetical protein